ncbi:MAG: MFS transporter [Candidatus Heimdallarchaeota archaeon]|nr:MFS transporter [Candidatus Heimdallarchaeota archaeon]
MADQHRTELLIVFISTFLLRTGFGGVIIIFDWVLVWGIEHALGVDNTASVEAILLISFSAITYYIAEIGLTGYYGNKSDKIGVKPVIFYATTGGAITMLLYAPTPYIFAGITNVVAALYLMTLYLAVIHFVHGIFASAQVAPSLGFINKYSKPENRALNMSFYDNAILYGRAIGILIGGFLWIIFKVDEGETVKDQARLISFTFPFLALIIFIAAIMIKIGLPDLDDGGVEREFSIKEDVKIAARVMLEPKRRPLLLPWISIAALIGSASLWGPTVSFIVSPSDSSHRGFEALLPLMIVLTGLALPAPLWGIYADRHGKKKTLLIGLFGLPIAGILGLAIGYPFFKDDISISNIYFLLSALPAAFMFSAMIPVLMGILGDTAEDKHDGKVMSGYHFIIATGEIFGILVGGLVIGVFSLVQSLTGFFGEGTEGNGIAILIGFVLFELTLVAGMIIGILKLPNEFTD